MVDGGRRYVALDFGAESGRTIVGTIADDKLTIEPVHRYANVPVKMGGTLYWDFPRQFGDILDGLRKASADGPVHSVSVDTWGVDYGYIDARGRLIGNPVHYRDTRHEGMLEEAFAVIPRDELYMATGIQFMSINTLYQMLSEVRANDPILEGADKMLMMPDIFNHFLCGADVAEYTEATSGQTVIRGRRTGPPRSSTAWVSPRTSCRRSSSRGPSWARSSTRSPTPPAAREPRSWRAPRTTRPRPSPAPRWPATRPPTSRPARGRWWASKSTIRW